MKKLLVGMMVAVMGLSMAASALPAVTYDETGCELSGVISGEYNFWIMLLIQADVSEIASALPSSLAGVGEVDMDFMGMDGENYILGDGVPDLSQLALLTSAACADETIATGLAANGVALQGTLDDLAALIAWASADVVGEVSTLDTLATDLNALAAQLVAMGAPYSGYAPSVAQLGGYLNIFATGLLPEVNSDSSTAETAGALTELKEVIAALGSLSANSKGLLEALLGSLLAGLNEPVEDAGNLTPSEIAAQIAGGCAALAPTLAGLPGQAALAQRVSDAGTYCATGAGLIAAPAAPSFNVLGVTVVAKVTYNQGFAAAGDYNNDGVTNLEMWDIAGGDTAKFVAQASGADPWWTGNPNLPAVGLAGLAALIGAISAGGATMLRKK